MNNINLDALLTERNLQITSLNRELLHFSEFHLEVDWSNEDQQTVKKAFQTASRKMDRRSCTNATEKKFYSTAIEQLSNKVKNIAEPAA